MGPLLEVCVDTAAGAAAASAAGADRLELCAALEIGGVTPSVGLMRAARGLGLPVSVMIRPRGGDFVYDQDELTLMELDIWTVRAEGLSGVVFGALTPEGALDVAVLRRLQTAARGLETTLHRAFDLTTDLTAALDDAVALGFTRLLTSGGQERAVDGAAAIARLVERARDMIVVMPGGGVRPDNVRALLDSTGATEIHASCAAPEPAPPAPPAVTFAAAPRRLTSREAVRALRAAMDPAAIRTPR